MIFLKIDRSNVDIAHKIASSIFPHYDALNNYLDSFKDDAKGEFFLIKLEDDYIGIIGLYSYDDYPLDAWLGWFGFLDWYRHHGYGKEAIKFFEDLARSKGFKYARLFTDTFDNESTKRFYINNGYVEERYINEDDKASLLYPISIFSKSLYEEECPKWNNRDIHFSKQVDKQQ